MSYAAMMVHLGAHADWHGRVRLAADLAHRYQAALIGIAGWLSSPAFALDDIAADVDTTDAEGEHMTARLAEMGEQFRAAAKQVAHVEWRGMLDYPRTMVPREARAADLLIIGRSHPSLIMALAREVSRQLMAMTERVMTATSAEVPVRLSQLLLEFVDDGHGEIETFVPLSHPLTHESMAQIIGASRPHTSTVLRDLEGRGAVKRRSGRGLLVSPSRLRHIVEFGDADLPVGGSMQLSA